MIIFDKMEVQILNMKTLGFFKKIAGPLVNFFEELEGLKLNNNLNYPSGNPSQVIFFYLKEFKKSCAVAFLMAVTYALIDFGKFYFIELIVNFASSDLGKEQLNIPLLIISFVVIFGLISPFVWVVHSLIIEQALSATIRHKVQKSLHGNIVQQDLKNFKDRLSGQTTMRLHQTANAIRTGITLIIDQIPSGLIQFIGTAIMVGTITPSMIGPVVFWIIANVVLVAWLIPRYSQAVQHIVSTASTTSGHLSDVYNNIITVKMYDQRAKDDPVIATAFDNQATAQRILCRYNTTLSCAIHFLNAWLLIFIITIGIWAINKGAITTGELAAAIALVFRLTTSVDWFTGVGQGVIEVYGALRDAQSVFALGQSVKNNKPLNIVKPNIILDNVTFGYGDGTVFLKDINLTISPGEKIGIIGESGSGKSTIVNLLSGLFQPTTGRILIDGVDLAEVDGDALREQLAIVTQDTSLLNRSIKDNILYGMPNRGCDDIYRVLTQAGAEKFVLKLKDSEGRKGLMSFAGEKGMTLSGGERQRIIIARALLKNAKILILDEATSALDVEMEGVVMKYFIENYRDLVIISITHRISTLKNFDRILKLKDGRLEPYVEAIDY